jgi:hypothetical protein
MNICIFAHMMNLSSSSWMVLLISEGSFFSKIGNSEDPHPPPGGVSVQLGLVVATSARLGFLD